MNILVITGDSDDQRSHPNDLSILVMEIYDMCI